MPSDMIPLQNDMIICFVNYEIRISFLPNEEVLNKQKNCAYKRDVKRQRSARTLLNWNQQIYSHRPPTSSDEKSKTDTQQSNFPHESENYPD